MEKVIDACNFHVYTTIASARVVVGAFINYKDCERTDGF